MYDGKISIKKDKKNILVLPLQVPYMEALLIRLNRPFSILNL